MKTILFILTGLSIFTAFSTYVYIRSWQALEIIGHYRMYYSIFFWMLTLLIILSRVIRIPGAGWMDVLQIIGSQWIAVLLYASLLIVTIDVCRGLGQLLNLHHPYIHNHYLLAKLILFGIAVLILTVIFVAGYRKARYPKVTDLEITVNKPAGEMKELRIAMVSDLHLGCTAGSRFLRRVVERINELDADVVLLAGDTFDGDSEPVIRKDMGKEFDRLKSRYGTFAISGNHEYIGERFEKGSTRRALEYLRLHGITVLVDSTVTVNNSVHITGRNDYSVPHRKPLAELIRHDSLPHILLDHQPYHLEETQQAGIDLQLSGHTHHGQMFPIHFITQKLYEKDWGYLQKGDSHFYISCGAGTWGPLVRTAGHSEIVLITMKLRSN
ncbi:MAG: metallophosphoesterase [Bacteroidales bacterium]|jgi:predicted MPP superfamily phosphohydrolase|nr:metallophosphoesterase [Bacteroidales bacterium]